MPRPGRDHEVRGESNEMKSSPASDEATPRVVQRITDEGYYYQAGDKELGPFTIKDEQGLDFDLGLAAKLGVKPKEILAAQLREIARPTTLDEVAEALGTTIRQDKATKLILLLAGVLTFTEEDQVNVLMSGESSGGKSYITLEVAAYFPEEVTLIVARASPTAFFHETGKWDEEAKVLRVDLKQKLLILLDQPHYTLLEMLRSLLSHDKPELLHKITDKSKRGELRTKNVIIQGYPTVVFCAAKLTMDEQERTRVFILSPETNQAKIEESLRLTITRVGDRQGFKEWINSHPKRRWLERRITSVQNARIRHVTIKDPEGIYARFRSSHPHLAPRHQRDLPRVLSLIKAHALLNHFHREQDEHGSITATEEDVEAGFNLYSLIAKPNELGLSPQVYETYTLVIKPLLSKGEGVSRKEIMQAYHIFYGRPLARKKLEEEVLISLEMAGLITEEPDPNDKRRLLVCPPDAGNISQGETHGNNVPQMWGTQYGEHVQAGICWLSDSKNLDAEGWAPLDKFTEAVGGRDTVELMLREGLIVLHPSKLTKLRFIGR